MTNVKALRPTKVWSSMETKDWTTAAGTTSVHPYMMPGRHRDRKDDPSVGQLRDVQ